MARARTATRAGTERWSVVDLSDPFVLSEVEALAKRIAFDCAQAEWGLVQLDRKAL